MSQPSKLMSILFLAVKKRLISVIRGWYLLGVYSDEVPEEVLTPILEDVERFQELTEVESNLNLIGSFYPIQYSAVDVDGFCLINFPVWGSSGNAQIIFKLYDGGDMSFSFEESLR